LPRGTITFPEAPAFTHFATNIGGAGRILAEAAPHEYSKITTTKDTTNDTHDGRRCKIEKLSVVVHLRWRAQFAPEPARCFPGFHRVD
jgi:hypothetical protein